MVKAISQIKEKQGRHQRTPSKVVIQKAVLKLKVSQDRHKQQAAQQQNIIVVRRGWLYRLMRITHFLFENINITSDHQQRKQRNAHHVANTANVLIHQNTRTGGEEHHAEVKQRAQFIKHRNDLARHDRFNRTKLFFCEQTFIE